MRARAENQLKLIVCWASEKRGWLYGIRYTNDDISTTILEHTHTYVQECMYRVECTAPNDMRLFSLYLYVFVGTGNKIRIFNIISKQYLHSIQRVSTCIHCQSFEWIPGTMNRRSLNSDVCEHAAEEEKAVISSIQNLFAIIQFLSVPIQPAASSHFSHWIVYDLHWWPLMYESNRAFKVPRWLCLVVLLESELRSRAAHHFWCSIRFTCELDSASINCRRQR